MTKLLLAAGIGCIAGLLFAPRKGSDLRSELFKGLEAFQAKLEEQGDEIKEETSGNFSRASAALAKAGESASDAFNKLDKNLHEIFSRA